MKDYKRIIIKTFKKLLNYHSTLGKRGNSQTQFRIISYKRAITGLENFKKPIYKTSDAKNIDGIGKKSIEKIDEIIKTGSLKKLSEIDKDPLQKSREELQTIIGIGPTKSNKLVNDGIMSIPMLVKAVKNKKYNLGRVSMLGLKYYKDLQYKIPKSEITHFKKLFEKSLLKKIKNIKIYIAGSYRTGKSLSKDIDMIITLPKDLNLLKTSTDFENILTILKKDKLLIDIMSIGSNKIMGLTKLPKNIMKTKPHYIRQIDIRLIPIKLLPWYLLYFGSGENFSRKIRKIAKDKGYKLDQWGLSYRKNKKRVDYYPKTEKEIFSFLKIKYIKPSNRINISSIDDYETKNAILS